MTVQEQIARLFEDVKDKAEHKTLSHGMEQYTFLEDGWRYDFFTSNGVLTKCEYGNHRELYEVWCR